MTATTPPLRIAVADDERDTRQFFEELLPPLGHEVVGVAEDGRRLVELCQATRPDLVITDIKMPDMDGVQAAVEVNRERAVPVILVTGHHEVDFLSRAGAGAIMACLTKPVKPADLQASIALAVQRFEQFRLMSREADDLRQALEDRKVIERAKGALMRRLAVDEEGAFRRMRLLASSQNRKLIDVARQALAAEDVFSKFEKA